MALDWERLATRIKQAREELGITQAELAGQAGVALRTVQNLESGVTRKRPPVQADKVSRALGWANGSIEDILDGGDPTPLAERSNALDPVADMQFILKHRHKARPQTLSYMKALLEGDLEADQE